MCHSCWASALEPTRCNCWSFHPKPPLCNKRSRHDEKPTHGNKARVQQGRPRTTRSKRKLKTNNPNLALQLERKEECRIKYSRCPKDIRLTDLRGTRLMPVSVSLPMCNSLHRWLPGLNSGFIHPSWSKSIPPDNSFFNKLPHSMNQIRLNNRTQGKKHSLITYSVWWRSYDFKIRAKREKLSSFKKFVFLLYIFCTSTIVVITTDVRCLRNRRCMVNAPWFFFF